MPPEREDHAFTVKKLNGGSVLLARSLAKLPAEVVPVGASFELHSDRMPVK
jgi:hypothetical protein